MLQFSKTKLYVWAGSIALVVAIGFLLSRTSNKSIEISNTSNTSPLARFFQKNTSGQAANSLTGIKCNDATTRPYAVMMSSDQEARPLSGIGDAEMVFEMPVVENGFTRMMAVYQCNQPKELGSIRSSRMDFVPLALGLNAIYAHFGGEKQVLEELNSGIIDNIDGLKYDGTIYYRKPSIPKPHNAFTNFSLLKKAISQLNYKTDGDNISYPHEKESISKGTAEPGTIFTKDFQVTWKYNSTTNSYFRTRYSKPEIDKNTNQQVQANNVIIMKTTWSPVSKDYIRVKTVGSGGLLVYKDGAVTTGTWEKKEDHSKLYFYDQNHKEIELAPGNIWVEITTQ